MYPTVQFLIHGGHARSESLYKKRARSHYVQSPYEKWGFDPNSEHVFKEPYTVSVLEIAPPNLFLGGTDLADQ